MSKKTIFLFLSGCLLLWYLLALPSPLFQTTYSTILEDQDGQLLGAQLAPDEQWRFPLMDEVPDKFRAAIITFEDKRFNQHIGVDIRGLIRAFGQNIRAGKIVSGGSTISMQVIRLSRNSPGRTLFEKVVEVILATRLTLSYSKSEVLSLYASHAPFGGNVVGLPAASWRYFGKRPDQLSWGEAATLAVLPNAPGLIHPGRNRSALLAKRNRLLQRMEDQGILSTLDRDLAEAEPLPDKPHPLPRFAPHVIDYFHAHGVRAQIIRSTLDKDLQAQLQQVLTTHQSRLNDNGIHNAGIIVAKVETGEVVAYHGNIPNAGGHHAESVDVVQANRSTGSILKPLLYARMLQEGELLPKTVLSDIPTYIDGYRPTNFFTRYDGLVPADQALVRSLNIPFVKMLQEHGVPKFHRFLEQQGFTSFKQGPDHYGLSLILGGGEVSLWELCGVYATHARVLNQFHLHNGQYAKLDVFPLQLRPTKTEASPTYSDDPVLLDAASTYHMFEAMRRLERPSNLGQWKRFQSGKQIAWKTGTSIGFRDAWAVGVNPEYVVGVWVGNADGEGRPKLIGIEAAAPILFDIFQFLPHSSWFEPPMDAMQQYAVCTKSGYQAGPYCEVDTIWSGITKRKVSICPFHQQILVDTSESWQVQQECYDGPIIPKNWYVIPAIEAHYLSKLDPAYQPLPPIYPDCQHAHAAQQVLDVIYPRNGTIIQVPKDLGGSRSKSIFEAAHRSPNATVHWHLDQQFLATTQGEHKIELDPAPGKHLLTLVDEQGNKAKRRFEVME